MVIQDDRTAEQRNTHTWLIAGTDSFMSGWGHARNGTSIAVWACEPQHRSKVLQWVENRGDMKRVREVGSNYRPHGHGHCHIYVVGPDHPSLI